MYLQYLPFSKSARNIYFLFICEKINIYCFSSLSFSLFNTSSFVSYSPKSQRTYRHWHFFFKGFVCVGLHFLWLFSKLAWQYPILFCFCFYGLITLRTITFNGIIFFLQLNLFQVSFRGRSCGRLSCRLHFSIMYRFRSFMSRGWHQIYSFFRYLCFWYD